MPQAKILYVNDPKWVEKMRKMRSSIKVEIDGGEQAYINGDEHEFDDMKQGQTVAVYKDGKGYWQLGEGSAKSVSAPAQSISAPQWIERTPEELRKRGSERVTLFIALAMEVKTELEASGMAGLPDNVILATTSHIFNATVQ